MCQDKSAGEADVVPCRDKETRVGSHHRNQGKGAAIEADRSSEEVSRLGRLPDSVGETKGRFLLGEVCGRSYPYSENGRDQ